MKMICDLSLPPCWDYSKYVAIKKREILTAGGGATKKSIFLSPDFQTQFLFRYVETKASFISPPALSFNTGHCTKSALLQVIGFNLFYFKFYLLIPFQMKNWFADL